MDLNGRLRCHLGRSGTRRGRHGDGLVPELSRCGLRDGRLVTIGRGTVLVQREWGPWQQ